MGAALTLARASSMVRVILSLERLVPWFKACFARAATCWIAVGMGVGRGVGVAVGIGSGVGS